jgi:xanthine dehydrogenase molybdopterin-binding subunit B
LLVRLAPELRFSAICLRTSGMRTTVQPYSKIIHERPSRAADRSAGRSAEDLRFLTCVGKFVDDLKRDGMLHAVVLRSGVAHGRINRLDTSAARAKPGDNGPIHE